MIFSRRTKDDLKDLEVLADLESNESQVRLFEMLGTQSFHYDTIELFEPISKAVTDTSQKLLEKTKPTTKTIEELDESYVHVKNLDLLNKIGMINSSLIRLIANSYYQHNKVNFEHIKILIVIIGKNT